MRYLSNDWDSSILFYIIIEIKTCVNLQVLTQKQAVLQLW